MGANGTGSHGFYTVSNERAAERVRCRDENVCQAHPDAWCAFAAGPVLMSACRLAALLVSPFVGSFLGVVVRRLPLGRSVVSGRSACEACRHPLGVRDLVPLVSYAALRGRCRYCRASIAPMHPAIELASLAVAASAAIADGADNPRLWAGCVLGWTLLTLGWIDWKHLRLPDALTLPLILAGLAVTWRLDPTSLGDHAAAAAGGYTAFRLLGLAYARLRGREGLGQGDAKLLAASGAWVGVEGLPGVLFWGAICGLAIAGVSRLQGHRMTASSAIPFGPCLAASTWLVWLGG